MLKRILLIISIFTVFFLLLVGTNIKPFKTMITMAHQYVDGYTKGNSGLEDKEVEEKANEDADQPNKNPISKNDEPIKIEEPKTDLPDVQDPQDSLDSIDFQDTLLSFENTTLVDENGQQMVTNVDSLMVMVNKKRNLSADYIPENMVSPNVNFSFEGDSPKKYLREEAALALEELFQAAKNEELDLLATSGYRSYQTQKNIFENKAKTIGEKKANMYSAYPGQSEHQTGLAMDVTCSQASFGLNESFGELKEGIWVRENAHKFGFIIRYPKGKEEITGYSYEPWHLRFVGKEPANYVYKKDITLEEYFKELYNY